MKKLITLALGLSMIGVGAQAADAENSKPASQATQQAHEKVLARLPFENMEDFELAQRGLLARPDSLVVKNADGTAIWDMTR